MLFVLPTVSSLLFTFYSLDLLLDWQYGVIASAEMPFTVK